MSQRTDKVLRGLNLAVGIIVVTVLVVVGGAVLYQDAKGLRTKVRNSGEDRGTVQDPQSAIKAAFDKMSREVQERSQPQQPRGSWGGGWKK
jgi:hypothetical protein